MSKSKLELGKGIRALLDTIDNDKPVAKETVAALQQQSINIPISQIEANPYNPRVYFDESALNELVESIKIHGIIQPLTLRKVEQNRFQIISGERRWRASKLAGLNEVPAYIRTANDQAMIELALIENIQREDLNAIEIAITYKRLIDECNLTQEKLGERVGKERTTVTNYLRLLKLPPEIQKGIKEKLISMGHAKAIQSVEKIDIQLMLYKETIENELSVREVEEMARNLSVNKKTNTKSKTPNSNLPTVYRDIQKQLQDKLSTKVVLKRSSKGTGKIIIDFYNDEDLERLLETLV